METKRSTKPVTTWNLAEVQAAGVHPFLSASDLSFSGLPVNEYLCLDFCPEGAAY